ncbi:YesN14 [Paenibacillus mucilaginosus 3016]|uniref:YesN14 n=1 Tax=Paenibacillus mucilaginosus 3016 TaxID=1116391 RepID=H6NAW2_9BACL|nr:response regulator [Paenibacillus mucilaginosus]AFC30588.1 YesN14 [Paenibacillus mucilaginosus 3016]WFA19210.1 response regulator [Paenibacillus mucilaginosus]
MYKVLLVDDEPYAIEGLRIMVDWEKHGFQIDSAYGSGVEALRHILRDPPHLVVTDICMPVMNGMELMEETRREGLDSILFVIMSGHSDFDYARQAMRMGVSHYLTKPLIPSEVEEVLVQLDAELRERERRKLISDKAEGYAFSRSLSVLLYGSETAERREAARTLEKLADRASEWTYLHVETDEESSGRAREAAQRLAERSACCCLVDSSRGTFGLVYGSREPGSIRVFAERLHETVQCTSSGVRAGVAAGCSIDRFHDLTLSYSSALEAARFLYYSPAGIVHYADIQGRTLSSDPEALKAADTIIDAVEGGHPETVAAAVREAFRTFQERMTLPELVGIFTTQVLLRCAMLYKELGGNADELLHSSGFGTSMRYGSHIEETARMLTRFCLNCQSAASTLWERQTGSTQAQVADFLRRHYRETFTIKELADRFYINPVYLGQSFSRKYGVGILDYIHDLRIEEARRLLRETNVASYVIAESLGYCGYQHFLKQFEKRLGMKPAHYRLLFQREEQLPSEPSPQHL